MQNRMQPHHLAWLEAHPFRSSEWLSARLHDGFDVHHLDGNHGNNAPDNLVLIDHSDHMWLHFMGRKLYRVRSVVRRRIGPKRALKAAAKALTDKGAPLPLTDVQADGVWVTCRNQWKVFVRFSDSADDAQDKLLVGNG